MQVTKHVWAMHYDDGATAHPGGSNNCFVGNPKKEMALIDTGDHEKEWLKRIVDFHEELGSPKISSILITHGHFDHIGGLDRLHEKFQSPVRCHPKLVKKLQKIVGEENVIPLKSRELLHIDNITLQALFTPGHEVDHVCYYLRKDKVMFTGDTILGSSSTTVQDLYSYMKSLKLLTKFSHNTICPAHGKIVPSPRGGELVSWYINHREKREVQVLDSLRKGINNTKDIVSEIYPRNLKKGLRDSAERNVKTHLAKLIKDGLVTEESASFNLN